MDSIDLFFILIIAFVVCTIPIMVVVSGDRWDDFVTEIDTMNCIELKNTFVDDDKLNSSQENYIMKSLIKNDCL